MKIVKEYLNEIKQDKESALSTIGVGSTAINKAYKHITKTWPDEYEDYFDLISNAKHYYKSLMLMYPTISEEAIRLFNEHERIMYAVRVHKILPVMLRWCLKNVMKSFDLTEYRITISKTKYATIRYSESMGLVTASVYNIYKTMNVPVLYCTFFFLKY